MSEEGWLPYEKIEDPRREFWIKTLKETTLGVVQLYLTRILYVIPTSEPINIPEHFICEYSPWTQRRKRNWSLIPKISEIGKILNGFCQQDFIEMARQLKVWLGENIAELICAPWSKHETSQSHSIL